MDGDARGSNGNAEPAIAQRWPRIRQWLTLISAVIAAVGVAAAGIGYVKDGAQFASVIEGYFRDKSELSSFVATAAERLGHNDYEAAMAANAKARKLAPRDPSAAAQQAQIAMIWLEDVRISSADRAQSFAAVVDPLKAVLVERLAKTEGAMKADIQAHIGWANFLHSRDGYSAIDVAEEFDAAIAEDPNNLYGHVMRGFWTLWRGEPIDRARADFNVAMQSVTNPAFSDSLIMASLTNLSSDEFMAGAVEYADAIRRAGRNLDDPIKRRLISYYWSCLHDKDLLGRIGNALSPSEQTVFLDWLKQGTSAPGEQRIANYFAAYFAERGGETSDALRRYGGLVMTSAKDKEFDNIDFMSREAMRRLQK